MEELIVCCVRPRIENASVETIDCPATKKWRFFEW